MAISLRLWLLILLTVVILAVLFVTFVRRGVWVCIWRAGLLLGGLGLLGASGLGLVHKEVLAVLSAHGISNVAAVSVSTALLATGVLLYFKYWVQPYWKDTYQLNRDRRKFDLERRTYSVTTSWARRKTSASSMATWMPFVISAGPGLYFLLRSNTNWETVVFFSISLFMLWAAVAMATIEFYNAYKLWSMERTVGGPLVIDAYAAEG